MMFIEQMYIQSYQSSISNGYFFQYNYFSMFYKEKLFVYLIVLLKGMVIAGKRDFRTTSTRKSCLRRSTTLLDILPFRLLCLFMPVDIQLVSFSYAFDNINYIFVFFLLHISRLPY